MNKRFTDYDDIERYHLNKQYDIVMRSINQYLHIDNIQCLKHIELDISSWRDQIYPTLYVRTIEGSLYVQERYQSNYVSKSESITIPLNVVITEPIRIAMQFGVESYAPHVITAECISYSIDSAMASVTIELDLEQLASYHKDDLSKTLLYIIEGQYSDHFTYSTLNALSSNDIDISSMLMLCKEIRESHLTNVLSKHHIVLQVSNTLETIIRKELLSKPIRINLEHMCI